VNGTQVLVVEDEADGLDVIIRVLSAKGLDTLPFDNAETALDVLTNQPERFRVAIIDLALPGIDGFELMHLIRNNPALANIVLIAITAYHTPELRVKALESGFDAYYEKPLNQSAFSKAVTGFVQHLA